MTYLSAAVTSTSTNITEQNIHIALHVKDIPQKGRSITHIYTLASSEQRQLHLFAASLPECCAADAHLCHALFR